MTIFTLCVAGAESTGKSWLAARLAAHFGVEPVAEYARGYCARHGNALSMAQLVHIGKMQERLILAAIAAAARPGAVPIVVADTDAVVTAAWARAMHGCADPWLAGPRLAMTLTLVTDNDVPWEDDGVRIQRDPAARDIFRTILIDELDRRGRSWIGIGGAGEERLACALAILAERLPGG